MINKQIEKLQKLLSEIEANIIYKDLENLTVSKSTIGWQLDHSLKVFNAVCKVLAASNPEDYKSNFNLTRWFIFLIGRFPRGKVKAPKQVVSTNSNISENILRSQLEEALIGLKIISTLDKHAFFKHHIFGNLSKKQTFRFLEIHTNHHLDIVKEILLIDK
ncbi:DUF1569 domain-containing protein [Tamlana sp. 2_MG-2023]|uniref:DUF1569 domain-containing protein n=1 Tax=unclassified Tamlana TaxID=2614803 RepID=UPI0026E2788F|nr:MULTISPECIES: DUF1569 domain-containing protein [unclassified Tamlana]MDO6760585.1 DUF1569 domain-containing protein [Tamlana sp. 2_MG-2023]MDO6790841.1 DUF1569 domain-containing protein [Tamlana sp. 1_MG-2023]